MIHALHVAGKNFRLVLGEVDRLVGAKSPAKRDCGFQKFRAFDERLSMDSEAFLVGFLAGEDFECLFVVEPGSVSSANVSLRSSGDILDALSRRRFVCHVGNGCMVLFEQVSVVADWLSRSCVRKL